jgi:hypothetical protein
MHAHDGVLLFSTGFLRNVVADAAAVTDLLDVPDFEAAVTTEPRALPASPHASPSTTSREVAVNRMVAVVLPVRRRPSPAEAPPARERPPAAAPSTPGNRTE